MSKRKTIRNEFGEEVDEYGRWLYKKSFDNVLDGVQALSPAFGVRLAKAAPDLVLMRKHSPKDFAVMISLLERAAKKSTDHFLFLLEQRNFALAMAHSAKVHHFLKSVGNARGATKAEESVVRKIREAVRRGAFAGI